MVRFAEEKRGIVAVALILLASFPAVAGGYVRAEIPRNLPTGGMTYACNDPQTRAICPTDYTEFSRDATEVKCKKFDGTSYSTCYYFVAGNIDGAQSDSLGCPSNSDQTETSCAGAGGTRYVCQNPTVDGGMTKCDNALRRRRGVDRSPDWVKKRQAKRAKLVEKALKRVGGKAKK